MFQTLKVHLLRSLKNRVTFLWKCYYKYLKIPYMSSWDACFNQNNKHKCMWISMAVPIISVYAKNCNTWYRNFSETVSTLQTGNTRQKKWVEHINSALIIPSNGMNPRLITVFIISAKNILWAFSYFGFCNIPAYTLEIKSDLAQHFHN